MDLRGWKYTGRKISPDFHKAVILIHDFIDDTYAVANRKWPAIQKDLAIKLDVAPGQIRTLKSLMEEVGILKVGSLNMHDVPTTSTIYTKDGADIVRLLKIYEMLQYDKTSINIRDMNQINAVVKLLYLKAMGKRIIIDGNNTLHPLRATLKALMKFECLDYWEWYLLNTIVKNDDDVNEEVLLEEKILQYRESNYDSSEFNIINQTLSHSYILGNFQYTGILKKQNLDVIEQMHRKFIVLPNLEMQNYIDEIIG